MSRVRNFRGVFGSSSADLDVSAVCIFVFSSFIWRGSATSK
jgi:hypothetical protein